MIAWSFLVLLRSDIPALAAPLPQNTETNQSGLFLLPLGETVAELLTHTVDVDVSVDENRSLRMDIQASYRLHNPTQSAIVLLLQANRAETNTAPIPPEPQAIFLDVDGSSVSLEATGNGTQRTAQINFDPDQRRTLLLRYTLIFAAIDLPAFDYPAYVLDIWPGRVGSWRVTLAFADAGSGLLAPDNWLAAQPDGWTFNGTRLQWLSEDAFPSRALRWQVIHPTIWQDVQGYQQAIQQQPTEADFRSLGDLYRRLYETAGQQAGAQSIDRERFYAQALSTYADGLRFVEQAGGGSSLGAHLHQALAALYRSRSIGPEGSVDFAYVELMVAEAEIALGLLPADAENDRSEVVGWLADGLGWQARQAQQRREWPTALALLDRLAALPNSPADGTQLAEERHLLLLEQALQLLAQGNQEAALALAGDSFATSDFLPAPERQSVFARWELTLALSTEGSAVHGTAQVLQGREAAARQIVEQLVLAWNNARAGQGDAHVQFDGSTVTIALSGVSVNDRLALIQATPQSSHWALLRTLLVNGDAEVERVNHLIWQRTTVRYSLDLRPVADQWAGIGASLERDSLGTEQTGPTTQRIQSELRALSYRQEAEVWQGLIRNSRVQIELAASANPEDSARRLWSVQITDPPQPLVLMAESLSYLHLFLAIALAMAGIFLLAGILWLLL